MVVTSTPDGPATHTHSKTLAPTDTTPPADVHSMVTSNTGTVNVPPTSHRRPQGHSLTNADDRSLLQMHFKMAT